MQRAQPLDSAEQLLINAKVLVDSMTKAQLNELYDYVDEALWDKELEIFPEALVQLERETIAADEAGLTQPLDFSPRH